MSVTLSASRVYTQDSIAPDVIGYAGPDVTLSWKDQLILSRVFPKPTADFAGMARPSARLVRDVWLNGGTTTKALVSLTLQGAIPVGISDASLALIIADFSAYLALEVANTTKVFKTLDLTY